MTLTLCRFAAVTTIWALLLAQSGPPFVSAVFVHPHHSEAEPYAPENVLYPVVPKAHLPDNTTFMAVKSMKVSSEGSIELCIQFNFQFYQVVQINIAFSGKITAPGLVESAEPLKSQILKYAGMFGVGISLGVPKIAIASFYWQRTSELEVEFLTDISKDETYAAKNPQFRFVKAIGYAISDWALGKVRWFYERILGKDQDQRTKVLNKLTELKKQSIYEVYFQDRKQEFFKDAPDFILKVEEEEKSLDGACPGKDNDEAGKTKVQQIKDIFDDQLKTFLDNFQDALLAEDWKVFAKPNPPVKFWVRYREILFTAWANHFYVKDPNGGSFSYDPKKPDELKTLFCEGLIPKKENGAPSKKLQAFLNIFVCRLMSRGLLLNQDQKKEATELFTFDSTKVVRRKKNTMFMIRKTLGQLAFNDPTLGYDHPCRISEKALFKSHPKKPAAADRVYCVAEVIQSIEKSKTLRQNRENWNQYNIQSLLGNLVRHSSKYAETIGGIMTGASGAKTRRPIKRTITTVFAVTAGTAIVGFCTPDDNLLQISRTKTREITLDKDGKEIESKSEYEANFMITVPIAPSVVMMIQKTWALKPDWAHREEGGSGINFRWSQSIDSTSSLAERMTGPAFIAAGKVVVDAVKGLWECIMKAKEVKKFSAFTGCVWTGIKDIVSSIKEGFACAKQYLTKKDTAATHKSCVAFVASPLGKFVQLVKTLLAMELSAVIIGLLQNAMEGGILKMVNGALALSPVSIGFSKTNYIEIDISKDKVSLDYLKVFGVEASATDGQFGLKVEAYATLGTHIEVEADEKPEETPKANPENQNKPGAAPENKDDKAKADEAAKEKKAVCIKTKDGKEEKNTGGRCRMGAACNAERKATCNKDKYCVCTETQCVKEIDGKRKCVDK